MEHNRTTAWLTMTIAAFQRNARIADWFNVVGIAMNAFLLLTFAVLPAAKSGRHYLSVGLCVCLIMLQLAFIVPVATRPQQCYDTITPNDMKSSLSCAWTGALVLAGGMGTVVWILLRSLYTHLRVCWDIAHSRTYMLASHALGWGVPAVILAVCLVVTGVSYRLGGTCFPNHHDSFADFFAWLLAFSGAAFLLQCATSGYCLWVYARHVFGLGRSTEEASGGGGGGGGDRDAEGQKQKQQQQQTAGNSSSTWTAPRAHAYKRVRAVFALQWRSITLCVLLVVETIFFATVFVRLNLTLAATKQDAAAVTAASSTTSPSAGVAVEAWAACLVLSGGDKDACLVLARALGGVDEPTVLASLMMIALTGISSFALLIRWSMVVGWVDLVGRATGRRGSRRCSDDFVMLGRETKRVCLDTTLMSQRTDDLLESPVAASFKDQAGHAGLAGGSKRASKRFSAQSTVAGSFGTEGSRPRRDSVSEPIDNVDCI